jgi:dimethylargininase
MRHALVRGVPDSFGQALTQAPKPRPLDPARARAQHAAYVAALRRVGVAVLELAPDPELPDGCFVEDTAVLVDGTALITRPGAPERRGEGTAVAQVLTASHRLALMEAPATLDGGDVLRCGDTLWIGRSGRTNDAGIAAARAAFPALKVVPVDVPGALHLKCHATALDDATILLADGTLDPAAFAGREVVLIPHDEAYPRAGRRTAGHERDPRRGRIADLPLPAVVSRRPRPQAPAVSSSTVRFSRRATPAS